LNMMSENKQKLDKQVYKGSAMGISPTKAKSPFDVKDLGIASPSEGKGKSGKLTSEFEKLN